MAKTPISRELTWQRFQKIIDPQILAAPRITWEQVDWRLMKYLTTKGDGSPWMNHLALLLAISLCHTRIDADTASRRIRSFHCHWTTIFPAYGLTHFAEWNPEVHMPRYLSDPDLPDSFETRQEFVRTYTASTRSLQIYLHSLPEFELTLYQQWVIPSLPVGLPEQLRQGKALRAAQEQRRKVEADAVAPHFAKIRGESHLRWNELFRLRQKAKDIATQVQAGTMLLPVVYAMVYLTLLLSLKLPRHPQFSQPVNLPNCPVSLWLTIQAWCQLWFLHFAHSELVKWRQTCRIPEQPKGLTLRLLLRVADGGDSGRILQRTQ